MENETATNFRKKYCGTLGFVNCWAEGRWSYNGLEVKNIKCVVKRGLYKRKSIPNNFLGYKVIIISQKIYGNDYWQYHKRKPNSLNGKRTFVNGCSVNEAKKFLKQYAKKIRTAGSGTVEVIWKPGAYRQGYYALRDLLTYIKIKEC